MENKKCNACNSSSEFEIHQHIVNDELDKLCKKISDFKDYSIGIVYQDSCIFLELTKKEWHALLKFLNDTKSKKNLPKNEDAYKGFWLSKDRAYYYSAKKQLKAFGKMAIPGIKKEAKVFKKYFLTRNVSFRKDSIYIQFDFKKFLRFREHCLEPRNIIRSDRYIKS